jgi:hypothetical protein
VSGPFALIALLFLLGVVGPIAGIVAVMWCYKLEEKHRVLELELARLQGRLGVGSTVKPGEIETGAIYDLGRRPSTPPAPGQRRLSG